LGGWGKGRTSVTHHWWETHHLLENSMATLPKVKHRGDRAGEWLRW
jgi:hypothetical protein